MNTDTYNLLNICLEIEGLLCLVERRGETIPKNVSDLLLAKTEALRNGMIRFTSVPAPVCKNEEINIPATVETAETVTEAAASEQIADAVELEEKEDACPDNTETASDENEKESSPKTEEVPAKEETTVATMNDVAPLELTVNDKFRFRRELFSNSDVDLADALQVASQMSTPEEIEDYFYNDLCFNPEDEVVKDFMRIVTKRFQ